MHIRSNNNEQNNEYISNIFTHTLTLTDDGFENRENSLQRKIAVCAIFHFGVWRALFSSLNFCLFLLKFILMPWSSLSLVLLALFYSFFFYYYACCCCVQPTTVVASFIFGVRALFTLENSFTTCTTKVFLFYFLNSSMYLLFVSLLCVISLLGVSNEKSKEVFSLHSSFNLSVSLWPTSYNCTKQKQWKLQMYAKKNNEEISSFYFSVLLLLIGGAVTTSNCCCCEWCWCCCSTLCILVRCGNECLRCQRGDYVDVIVNGCVPFRFVLSYARQHHHALVISTQKFRPQKRQNGQKLADIDIFNE